MITQEGGGGRVKLQSRRKLVETARNLKTRYACSSQVIKMFTIFILTPPPSPSPVLHNSIAARPKHRYHLNNIELGVGERGK